MCKLGKQCVREHLIEGWSLLSPLGLFSTYRKQLISPGPALLVRTAAFPCSAWPG